MTFVTSGAAVLSLAGTGVPSQIGASNGPSGSANLQDVNLATGNANSLVGQKPGVASGSFAFNAAALRTSIGTILAALIGTTPIAAQIGYVGASAGASVSGALAETWTLSVSENQSVAGLSGSLKYWTAEGSASGSSALTVAVTDVLDGITMQPFIGLGGTHLLVKSVSCGMRRTFEEAGRATTGFSAQHLIASTRYFVAAEVYVDSVSEAGQFSYSCPILGGITAAFGCSCIPAGDTGAAGVTLAFTNMAYDRPPNFVGNTMSLSAVSAPLSSTCTLS